MCDQIKWRCFGNYIINKLRRLIWVDACPMKWHHEYLYLVSYVRLWTIYVVFFNKSLFNIRGSFFMQYQKYLPTWFSLRLKEQHSKCTTLKRSNFRSYCRKQIAEDLSLGTWTEMPSKINDWIYSYMNRRYQYN